MLRSGSTMNVHDHVVNFYADDQEFVDRVGPYVRQGLAGRAVVVVVATATHVAALDAYLSAVGVDGPARRSSGRYLCRDAATTLAMFMRTGSVDAAAFRASVANLVEAAGRDGSPVLVFGEMVALLWERGQVGAALELESAWNVLAEDHQFHLLCAYPTAVLGSGALGDLDVVCGSHSAVHGPLGYAGTPQRAPAADYGRPGRCLEVFVPTLQAPGAARRFAAAILVDWGRNDLVESVALVVSELATNAVYHAKSPFRVFVHQDPRRVLLVGVKDVAPDLPAPHGHTPSGTSGRGLQIIEAVAQRWGCDELPEGKMVWAEFNAS